MTEVSHPTMELVTHGTAWLNFRVGFLSRTRKPLAANRLFQPRFWKEVLALKREDLTVSYEALEPSTIRAFLHFQGEYVADHPHDTTEHHIDFGYFGDVRIVGGCASRVLEQVAELVFSCMKTSAQEFLEFSKASADWAPDTEARILGPGISTRRSFGDRAFQRVAFEKAKVLSATKGSLGSKDRRWKKRKNRRVRRR